MRISKFSGPRILSVIALIGSAMAAGAAAPPTPTAPTVPSPAPTDQTERELAGFKAPLVQLGPGDSVAIQVYGQPDLNGTVYVADDGSIPVALAGAVKVDGLSPSEAGRRIEQALRDGKYLVDPHVTVTVTESRSQRVTVMGEVARPGRYAIQSNTSTFDLLAEAGGIKDTGGDIVYIFHPGRDGNVARYRVSLKSLSDGSNTTPLPVLNGGDSLFIPLAPQFYVYGEVTAPGKFKIEPGMTVVQAIARAGGITQRGSQNRIEIKRIKPDGSYQTTKAKLSDLVQADDVIRVKESIF